MTRPHDMKHLAQLRPVALADVEHLRMKEATYQGSWKRGGGRSAWFMLRRKIDRLLEMMKRPVEPVDFTPDEADRIIETLQYRAESATLEKRDLEIVRYLRDGYVAEDIFAKVSEAPGGEDGSVLAEIRDLRRYLLLVEAEMVSRGVIDEPRVTQELGQSIIRTVPRYDTSEEIVPRHGLPSGWNGVIERVFAGLDPWLLPKRAFLEAHDGSADRELLDQLYDDHGAGLVKLVPCLDEPLHFKLSVHVRQNTSVSSTLIRTALACYAKIGFDSKMHFLDVSRAPKDYRSAWPVLHHEYNAKELSDSERWIRDLYEWVEAETKYRVKPGFEYWTVRE